MTSILKLDNIRKSYGLGTPLVNEVLHGIHLDLAAGSFSALTGPSGSGKSTLLNIIGLLEPPTTGELSIAGQSINALDDAGITQLRGLHLGFIFQFHHLIPAFTALENVMMPNLIHQKLSPAHATQRANDLLSAVGLAAAKDKKINELSGGMQQRVAIARALLLNPPLVLADEPTGNLDTHTSRDIFNLLRKINETEGTAFLIVTHDQGLAADCDQRFELIDGILYA